MKQATRRRGLHHEGTKPAEDTLHEHVRPSNAYALPIVRLLGEGKEDGYQSLRDYLLTPRGTQELREIAHDDAKFDQYRTALLDPVVRKQLINFLKSDGGVQCLIDVGFTETGMNALIRLSQSDAGAELAKALRYRFGILYDCGKTMFLKLWTKRKEKPETADVELPSFDFERELKKSSLVELMRDPVKAEAMFFAFSENDHNTRLCRDALQNPEVRKLFLQYLVEDPAKAYELFNQLFSSWDRRAKMIDIFTSEGGVKLLKELSATNEGRDVMAKLAVTPYGMDLAVNLLWKLHKALPAGLSYLREE